jgi:hypothetical protein
MNEPLTFSQSCRDLIHATRSLLWQYTPENIFILGWIVGMVTMCLLFLVVGGK